jgi:hypothetical protein
MDANSTQSNSESDLYDRLIQLLGLDEKVVEKTGRWKIIKGIVFCKNCRHSHTQFFKLEEFSNKSWKTTEEIKEAQDVRPEDILIDKMMSCYLCDKDWKLNNGWI